MHLLQKYSSIRLLLCCEKKSMDITLVNRYTNYFCNSWSFETSTSALVFVLDEMDLIFYWTFVILILTHFR